MKKISPKAIRLWRIKSMIFAGVIFLIAFILFFISMYFWDALPWWVSLIPFGFFIYLLIVHVWILPRLKYRYFRYGVVDDEIRVHQGIFFKSRTAVPLFRVQNIDTTVGPLMRRMALTGISLKTSAQRVYIPELHDTEAEDLRRMIRALINETTGKKI